MSCCISPVLFVQVTVWEGRDLVRYTETCHTTEKSTAGLERERDREEKKLEQNQNFQYSRAKREDVLCICKTKGDWSKIMILL